MTRRNSSPYNPATVSVLAFSLAMIVGVWTAWWLDAISAVCIPLLVILGYAIVSYRLEPKTSESITALANHTYYLGFVGTMTAVGVLTLQASHDTRFLNDTRSIMLLVTVAVWNSVISLIAMTVLRTQARNLGEPASDNVDSAFADLLRRMQPQELQAVVSRAIGEFRAAVETSIFSALRQQVDELQRSVSELTRRATTFGDAIAACDNGIRGFTSQTPAFTSGMKKSCTALELLGNSLHDPASRLRQFDDVLTAVVQRNGFATLHERISALNTSMNGIDSSVTSLQQYQRLMDELQRSVSELTRRATTFGDAIAACDNGIRGFTSQTPAFTSGMKKSCTALEMVSSNLSMFDNALAAVVQRNGFTTLNESIVALNTSMKSLDGSLISLQHQTSKYSQSAEVASETINGFVASVEQARKEVAEMRQLLENFVAVVKILLDESRLLGMGKYLRLSYANEMPYMGSLAT